MRRLALLALLAAASAGQAAEINLSAALTPPRTCTDVARQAHARAEARRADVELPHLDQPWAAIIDSYVYSMMVPRGSIIEYLYTGTPQRAAAWAYALCHAHGGARRAGGREWWAANAAR